MRQSQPTARRILTGIVSTFLLATGVLIEPSHAGPVTYQVTTYDKSLAYYGSLPSGSWTALYGINDAGAIVGVVWDRTTFNSRAFLLRGPAQTFTDISIPGAKQIEAFGIDESDAVWGSYTMYAHDSTGLNFGSFHSIAGGLPECTPGGLVGPPTPLALSFEVPVSEPGSTVVYGINGLGQLVGSFGVDLDPGPARVYAQYGFLATPMLGPAAHAPEPTTWLSAVLGGLALTVVSSNWRRQRFMRSQAD